VSWYRGWDTLASVTRWHNFLEIAGIVCLALLVGTEILAFQYGHRKDALIVAAEEAVAEQRRRDPDATETRRKAEMEAAEARGRTEVDGQHNRLQKPTKRLRTSKNNKLIDGLPPFSSSNSLPRFLAFPDKKFA